MVANVDNEIAQALLQVTDMASRLKRTQQTVDEQNDTIQQQNNLISKSESEISRNNALVERKQTQIDQLNKKIGQKMSNTEGVSHSIIISILSNCTCTCTLLVEFLQSSKKSVNIAIHCNFCHTVGPYYTVHIYLCACMYIVVVN